MRRIFKLTMVVGLTFGTWLNLNAAGPDLLKRPLLQSPDPSTPVSVGVEVSEQSPLASVVPSASAPLGSVAPSRATAPRWDGGIGDLEVKLLKLEKNSPSYFTCSRFFAYIVGGLVLTGVDALVDPNDQYNLRSYVHLISFGLVTGFWVVQKLRHNYLLNTAKDTLNTRKHNFAVLNSHPEATQAAILAIMERR